MACGHWLLPLVVVQVGHHDEPDVGRVDASLAHLLCEAELGDAVLHRQLAEEETERLRRMRGDRRVIPGVDQERTFARVSPIGTISSTGRSAPSAWRRIASGLSAS
jgi:hypothetical protein